MIGARTLLADIARYYDSKVLSFGATALGVDWPSLSSIHTRLLTLLEVGDMSAGATLNDLGCGWGAAVEVLGHLLPEARIDYFGVDVAPAMIDAARKRWAARPRTRFVVGAGCPRVADYSIASGIFNVKLSHSREQWEHHVRQTLGDMHRHSTRGFAVNFMTATPATQDITELYCTEPQSWVEYCETLTGRRTQVVGTPGLAEFTLLVR